MSKKRQVIFMLFLCLVFVLSRPHLVVAAGEQTVTLRNMEDSVIRVGYAYSLCPGIVVFSLDLRKVLPHESVELTIPAGNDQRICVTYSKSYVSSIMVCADRDIYCSSEGYEGVEEASVGKMK